LPPPSPIVAPTIGVTNARRPAIVSFCRKAARQPARLGTARQPFNLSSEFHAYGAAPRVVRKALSRFDAKHVPYFMCATGRLGSLSLNSRIGRPTAGVMSAWESRTFDSGARKITASVRTSAPSAYRAWLDPRLARPGRKRCTRTPRDCSREPVFRAKTDVAISKHHLCF